MEGNEKIVLNKLQKISFKLFKTFGFKIKNNKFEKILRKADISIRADAYLSYSLFLSCIVFLSLFLSLPYLIFITTNFEILLSLLLSIMLSAFLGFSILLILVKYPFLRAKYRGRKIDEEFYHNFYLTSLLERSGVEIIDIFRILAKNKSQKEIEKEISKIYRNISFFGDDIITALEKNQKTNPSKKFRKFLKELTLTIKSGKSIKKYLRKKEIEYKKENKKIHQKNLKIISTLQKTYMIAEILIISSISALIYYFTKTQDSIQIFNQLPIILLALIPIIHLIFIRLIKRKINLKET
ncbi:MAG: type II secretion system F family protein [Candidatus Thermoplasmatota archaeon]